jgi:hypothetical protein
MAITTSSSPIQMGNGMEIVGFTPIISGIDQKKFVAASHAFNHPYS